MNIAVCIVGRVTGYENNIQCIQKFFDHLKTLGNLYLFFSLNTKKDEYHMRFEEKMNELNKSEHNYYNYEEFVIPDKINNCHHMYKMCSMFYNQHKCMQMIIESNIPFDIVFKWRSEINYDNFPIENVINDNTIYIPSDRDYGGINDQIAYGNLESMKKYSETYNNLELLTKEKRVRAHPETLLLHNIRELNLIIIRFPLNYYLHR